MIVARAVVACSIQSDTRRRQQNFTPVCVATLPCFAEVILYRFYCVVRSTKYARSAHTVPTQCKGVPPPLSKCSQIDTLLMAFI